MEKIILLINTIASALLLITMLIYATGHIFPKIAVWWKKDAEKKDINIYYFLIYITIMLVLLGIVKMTDIL